MKDTPRATLKFDDVTVTLELPHEAVDTETLIEAAHDAIRSGLTLRLTPRWNGMGRDDGPEFVAHVETLGEPTIEADDRTEKPEDFDQSLRWWREAGGAG